MFRFLSNQPVFLFLCFLLASPFASSLSGQSVEFLGEEICFTSLSDERTCGPVNDHVIAFGLDQEEQVVMQVIETTREVAIPEERNPGWEVINSAISNVILEERVVVVEFFDHSPIEFALGNDRSLGLYSHAGQTLMMKQAAKGGFYQYLTEDTICNGMEISVDGAGTTIMQTGIGTILVTNDFTDDRGGLTLDFFPGALGRVRYLGWNGKNYLVHDPDLENSLAGLVDEQAVYVIQEQEDFVPVSLEAPNNNGLPGYYWDKKGLTDCPDPDALRRDDCLYQIPDSARRFPDTSRIILGINKLLIYKNYPTLTYVITFSKYSKIYLYHDKASKEFVIWDQGICLTKK